MDREAWMTLASHKLGMQYNTEQKNFIYDCDGPSIVYASPGTGKTATVVGALVYLETFCSVPGKNIYALSFTNLATAELSVRHSRACEKLGMRQTVNFQTFHRLCLEVLKANYRLLGMTDWNRPQMMKREDAIDMIQSIANEKGIKVDPLKIKYVVSAINELNNSLTFDKKHVESKMCFLRTGISYEDFTVLRKMMYEYGRLTNTVQVSDIMLYTLELLKNHPEVSEAVKKECRYMFVDESQDFSLLHLAILNQFTDNPILIGDIKQQIYQFNGACQEIVQQFLKMYPDAHQHVLKQSYRCANEIADFATPLILPNKTGGEEFTGNGPGGLVEVTNEYSINSICDKIAEEFESNRHIFNTSYMFLFRNNFSAIPVVESLWRHGLPVRCSQYSGAQGVPLIKECCEIINMVDNKKSYSLGYALEYMIPELKNHRTGEMNIVTQIAKSKDISFFDVNYCYDNPELANKAMRALMQVEEGLQKGETVGKLINYLWPVLSRTYINDKIKYLDNDPDYYLGVVRTLVESKTFNQFYTDEISKIKDIKENNSHGIGVRCYTMHSAKGLEADVVYIVDADAGIIPNMSKLKKMVRRGCLEDAAREIRNERSLVYVACTRAKKELRVLYNEELSSLFTKINNFTDLDEIYEKRSSTYDDIEKFEEFYR